MNGANATVGFKLSFARALRFAFAVFIPLVIVAAFSAEAKAQLDSPILLAVSATGDDSNSEIIMDFDRGTVPTVQLLEHPWRLVLDFDRIRFGFDPKSEQWTGFAKDIRWGDMSAVSSRIIFQMDRPFKVSGVNSFLNLQSQTYRLIVNTEGSTSEAFRVSMLDKMRTSAVVNQSAKSDRLGAKRQTPQSSERFLIVLDAGHGGIDSGAVGKSGTLEKLITLNFAQELKKELENFAGVDVLLTRTTDVFVPLNDRLTFARQNGASLFVSIHADSVDETHVRGATIYTISDRASDSVAAQIADSENRSDAIAGLAFDDEPENVSDILIDLARRETLGLSVQFARLAVKSVSEKIQMIRNPHRFADFRVLRAPDVPSVLIELGFLSSEQDEKLLTNPEWRGKTAAAVAKAIERFALLIGRQNVVSKAVQ